MTLYRNVSTDVLDQTSADGEAQAPSSGPITPPIADLRVLVEDECQVLGRDANPGVAHPNQNGLFRYQFRGYRHATGFREFDRIAQQVTEDTGERDLIGPQPDGRLRQLGREMETLGLSEWEQAPALFGQQRVERELPFVER